MSMGSVSADPRRRSALVALAVFVLPAALVIGWAISRFNPSSPTSQSAVPLILISITAVAIVAREKLLHGMNLLSPLALAALGFIVMFSLVPLADLRSGLPLAYHRSWWTASWLAWFALLTMYLGYRLAFLLSPSQPEPEESVWRAGRERVASATLLGLAALSLVILLERVGGLGLYVVLFRQRTLILQNNVPLILGVGLATPAVVLRAGGWLRHPTLPRALVVLFVWLPAALAISVVLGARFRLAGLALALVAVYHLGYRRLRFAVLALLAVTMAWFYVIAGVQRNFVGARLSAPSLSRSDFYSTYLSSHDVGEFREFVITLDGVPGRLPFQHGRTFLSIVPGLPVPTGGQAYSSAFFGAQYAKGTSISPSLLGELYMNFGSLGILVGMVAFGVAVGLLEAYHLRHPHRTGAVLIYSYSLLPVVLELRGDFTSMTGFYVGALLPLIVALRWIERWEGLPEPG